MNRLVGWWWQVVGSRATWLVQISGKERQTEQQYLPPGTNKWNKSKGASRKILCLKIIDLAGGTEARLNDFA